MKKAFLTILVAGYAILCGLTLFAQVPNTNEVATAVNTAIDKQRVEEFLTFEWLTQMSPLGLTFVFVVVIGYVFRRLNKIPNWLLGCLVPLDAALYTAMFRYSPAATWRDYLISSVFGTIVSTLGVGLVFIAHDKLLVWLAKKWPLLSFLLADEAVPDNCPDSRGTKPPPAQDHDNGQV